MFDIIWTDHNRENVGQHRARKDSERQRARPRDNDEHSQTRLASVSTQSSTSSTDKAFSFFGRKGSKKKKILAPSITSRLSQASTPNLVTQSQLKPPLEPSTAAISCRNSNDGSSDKAAPVQPTRGNYAPERVVESGECSPTDRSSKDSVTSKWTDRSGATAGTHSVTGANAQRGLGYGKSYVQDLGGGSYITKTTEYTFEKHSSKTNTNRLLSGITISSVTADQIPQAPSTPILQRSLSSSSTPRFERAVKPHIPSGDLDPSSLPAPTGRDERALMPLPALPSWVTKFAHTQRRVGAWKAPEEWESSAADISDSSSSTTDEPNRMMIPSGSEQDHAASIGLTIMQRETKRMAAATPAVIFVHLIEKWSNADGPEMEEEMLMEKQRWMLAAIHRLDKLAANDAERAILPRLNVPQVTKILALFESKGTASYLAALRHYAPVYHLSTEPLSHTIYPNVHPMLAPVVSPSVLSVAPQSFAEVYCLSLPSLMPSSDIPQMLRNIHRCLAPGGTLRLILLNAAPEADTLGPKLRAWLDLHLLLNLERKFRCSIPTKLFPGWLEDMNLRGRGSSIVKPEFQAAAVDLPESEDPMPAFDSDPRLYSHVGRMMWKEIWGSHVTADCIWWEDNDILEECIKHRTTWRYNLITAVREDRE